MTTLTILGNLVRDPTHDVDPHVLNDRLRVLLADGQVAHDAQQPDVVAPEEFVDTVAVDRDAVEGNNPSLFGLGERGSARSRWRASVVNGTPTAGRPRCSPPRPP